MNVLPRTQHRELAILIVFTALLFVAGAVEPFIWGTAPGVVDAILGCLMVVIAVGLWRMNRLARNAAVVLLWIITLVFTLGILNPLTIHEMTRNHSESFNVWLLAAKVLPFTAIGIFLIYVLGKYKAEFGRKPDVQ